MALIRSAHAAREPGGGVFMTPSPEPDEVHYQQEQPHQRDRLDDLGDRFPCPVTGDEAGQRHNQPKTDSGVSAARYAGCRCEKKCLLETCPGGPSGMTP